MPLDGQHRLAALQFAITGKDEKAKDIDNLSGSDELAKDVCSVILIRDDVEKVGKYLIGKSVCETCEQS